MKKLFCTVVTDYDGQFESPLIYHTRAVDKETAERRATDELEEFGYSPEEQDERFDIFTFEVTDLDIVEV
jgi:hypothetical protein